MWRQEIVFSLTAAVYGEPVTTPITETHPKAPINAYGESKLIFERILEWYQRAYGLQYTALRYFNAAGARVSILAKTIIPKATCCRAYSTVPLTPAGSLLYTGTTMPRRMVVACATTSMY